MSVVRKVAPQRQTYWVALRLKNGEKRVYEIDAEDFAQAQFEAVEDTKPLEVQSALVLINTGALP